MEGKKTKEKENNTKRNRGEKKQFHRPLTWLLIWRARRGSLLGSKFFLTFPLFFILPSL
jgi:hypothetical protein